MLRMWLEVGLKNYEKVMEPTSFHDFKNSRSWVRLGFILPASSGRVLQSGSSAGGQAPGHA